MDVWSDDWLLRRHRLEDLRRVELLEQQELEAKERERGLLKLDSSSDDDSEAEEGGGGRRRRRRRNKGKAAFLLTNGDGGQDSNDDDSDDGRDIDDDNDSGVSDGGGIEALRVKRSLHSRGEGVQHALMEIQRIAQSQSKVRCGSTHTARSRQYYMMHI